MSVLRETRLKKMMRRRAILGGGVLGCVVNLLVGSRSHGDSSALDDGIALLKIKELGAKGDGLSDDSPAFQLAGRLISRLGTGVLDIGPGTYRVGRQKRDNAGRYVAEPVLRIAGCRGPVIIRGHGAKLVANEGLRFGSFDPRTGSPIEPDLPFTDYRFRADAYRGLVDLVDNDFVVLEGLTLDGNQGGLILGGHWGDKGRQCFAHGVYAYCNRALFFRDLVCRDHATDGMIIGYPGLQETSTPTPVYLERVRCLGNGRQGLSWVGGIGLTAVECEFAGTGRGRVRSAPCAGVDIEAENSICRKGVFVNSRFADTCGVPLVADSGDSADCVFEGCSFIAGSSWALWPKKPQMRFVNCEIIGGLVNTYGKDTNGLHSTLFQRCRFRESKAGSDIQAGMLAQSYGYSVQFRSCSFSTERIKLGIFDHADIESCYFLSHFCPSFENDWLSRFRDARLRQSTINVSRAKCSRGNLITYVLVDNVDGFLQSGNLFLADSKLFRLRSLRGSR